MVRKSPAASSSHVRAHNYFASPPHNYFASPPQSSRHRRPRRCRPRPTTAAAAPWMPCASRLLPGRAAEARLHVCLPRAVERRRRPGRSRIGLGFLRGTLREAPAEDGGARHSAGDAADLGGRSRSAQASRASRGLCAPVWRSEAAGRGARDLLCSGNELNSKSREAGPCWLLCLTSLREALTRLIADMSFALHGQGVGIMKAVRPRSKRINDPEMPRPGRPARGPRAGQAIQAPVRAALDHIAGCHRHAHR